MSDYENKKVYIWTSGGDACGACTGMEGNYDSPPTPPHPDCRCQIDKVSVKAKNKGSESTEKPDGNYLKPIGIIPKGESINVTKNWSTGSTSTTTGSAGISSNGVSVQVGGSEATTHTEGESTNISFHYDEDIGGDMQLVVAAYDVYETTETTTWGTHWSENVGGHGTVDYTTTTTTERREIRNYWKIPMYEGRDAGEWSEEDFQEWLEIRRERPDDPNEPGEDIEDEDDDDGGW